MKELIKRLLKSRFKYTPLVHVVIDKASLLHNYNEFKKIAPNNTVAPVLKSNAYGHGLVQVGKIMVKEKPPFIIVDSYFEAVALRSHTVTSPLLIIGYTTAETILSNRLKNISFTITSLQMLTILAKSLTSPCSIHLKIDTGMSRQGIMEHEQKAAVECIRSNKNIICDGICSHFADADNSKSEFTETQILLWNKSVDYFLKEIPTLSFYHTSATSGHFYTKKIKANMSRLGLGLYGLSTEGPVETLVHTKPALRIETVISGIKKIEKGTRVGYSITYTAEKDMTIATLPLGYFEGVDRRLSSKGFVKIGNYFAPIIGRVSMNITTIDITDIPNVKLNDNVTVMSNNSNDKNSIDSIAKMCGTISYEIAVHISPLLERTVQ